TPFEPTRIYESPAAQFGLFANNERLLIADPITFNVQEYSSGIWSPQMNDIALLRPIDVTLLNSRIVVADFDQDAVFISNGQRIDVPRPRSITARQNDLFV